MSPMGDSGGRSRGNRDGQGAVRRNTHRERTDVDPVWGDEPAEREARKIVRQVSLVALAVFTVMLALFLGSLF